MAAGIKSTGLLQESGLLERLSVFWDILANESDNIVDDTHLDKVVDGLFQCEQNNPGLLVALLETDYFNFTSTLLECLSSEAPRVQAFALQIARLYARSMDTFKCLTASLQSLSAASASASWWVEVLRSGSTSAQYAVLSVLLQLLEYKCGQEWLAGSDVVATCIDCLGSKSTYVKKLSVDFLASCIARTSFKNIHPDGCALKSDVVKLASSLNQSLLPPVDEESISIPFVHAIDVVEKIIHQLCVDNTVDAAFCHLSLLFPSLTCIVDQLTWRREKKECFQIGNLFAISSAHFHLSQALFPEGASVDILLARVVAIVQSLFTKKFYSTAFSFLDSLASSPAHSAKYVQFDNILIHVLIKVMAAASCNPLLRPTLVLPDELVRVVLTSLSSGVSLFSASLTQLKGTASKFGNKFFKAVSQQEVLNLSCYLLSVLLDTFMGESPSQSCHDVVMCGDSPAISVIAQSTNVQRELITEDLLAVISECMQCGGRRTATEPPAPLQGLPALCGTLSSSVQHLNNFSSRTVCAILKCTMVVVQRVAVETIWAKSGLQPSSFSVTSVLSSMLRDCMEVGSPDVKDSAVELIQGLYSINSPGDLICPEILEEVAAILQGSGAHQVVRHCLGEVDPFVRATARLAVTHLDTSSHLLDQFCSANDISKVVLYSGACDMAANDESTIARMAAWQCIAQWHLTKPWESSLTWPYSSAMLDCLKSAFASSLQDEDQEVRIAAVITMERVVGEEVRRLSPSTREDPLQGEHLQSPDTNLKGLDLRGFFLRESEDDERVLQQLVATMEAILSIVSEEGSATEWAGQVSGTLSPALVELRALLETNYRRSPVSDLVDVLGEIVSSARAGDSKFAEADCY